jgi:putative hydrolase of the HAD superfamily
MVFFDIDDTLLDHAHAERTAAIGFGERHRAILVNHTGPFEALWRTASERHMTRFLAGELSFQEQRRHRLRDVLRPPLSDADADSYFGAYLALYEASWRLHDDVLPCLERLASCGLGVISDGSGEQQRQKLARTGILNKFSVIVTAEEAGRSKPDPELFRQACALAGKPPEHCWYVGDNRAKDALGAYRAGMKAVWLNRNGSKGEGDNVDQCHDLIEFSHKVMPPSRDTLNL